MAAIEFITMCLVLCNSTNRLNKVAQYELYMAQMRALSLYHPSMTVDNEDACISEIEHISLNYQVFIKKNQNIWFLKIQKPLQYKTYVQS